MSDTDNPRQVTLSAKSGDKVVKFDLYKLKYSDVVELTSLVGKARNQEEALEYANILAKALNITGEELVDLPHPDFRLVHDRMWELIRTPTDADPS